MTHSIVNEINLTSDADLSTHQSSRRERPAKLPPAMKQRRQTLALTALGTVVFERPIE
jgi:hypothetical protein